MTRGASHGRKLCNGTRVFFMDRPGDTGTIINDHKSPDGWATVSWDRNGVIGAGGTSQHKVTSLRSADDCPERGSTTGEWCIHPAGHSGVHENDLGGWWEVGEPVNVRLGGLLPRVDAWAAGQGMTRAAAIRELVSLGLRAHSL